MRVGVGFSLEWFEEGSNGAVTIDLSRVSWKYFKYRPIPLRSQRSGKKALHFSALLLGSKRRVSGWKLGSTKHNNYYRLDFSGGGGAVLVVVAFVGPDRLLASLRHIDYVLPLGQGQSDH